MKTLILTAKDIEKLLDMDLALAAVEESFKEHGLGRAVMPPKLYLHLPAQGGDFRAMPAFVADRAGIKWVSVYPDNRIKGLPTVIASLILSEPDSGFPLAIMDATLITNFRTGAGGGVAAKYLARSDSRSLGLIGTGAQAATQLAAVSRLFDLSKVLVWSVSDDSMDRFIAANPFFTIRKTPLDEVCGCDIVITTTPSKKPVIERRWIKEGTHINAIGADAPGKQELDPEILEDAKVIVDDTAQAVHSGEINVPISIGDYRINDVHGTLGEVVTMLKPGRVDQAEITVFDSTGLATQDIAVAGEIYRRAKKMGMGNKIDLIGV